MVPLVAVVAVVLPAEVAEVCAPIFLILQTACMDGHGCDGVNNDPSAFCMLPMPLNDVC